MQWPPPTRDAYEFLRLFKFRPERAWDDDAAVSDAAVGRAMLLGDIHNSRHVFEAALHVAIEEGCDVLVQVGDFGLQDSTSRGFAPPPSGVDVGRGALSDPGRCHRRQPRDLALSDELSTTL